MWDMGCNLFHATWSEMGEEERMRERERERERERSYELSEFKCVSVIVLPLCGYKMSIRNDNVVGLLAKWLARF